MNALKALQDHGQAVWLDFLSRGFIAKGGLKKLVDDDGLRGVTSNPSIFEHAIGNSDEYDDAIAAMLKEHDRSAGEIFEALAVEDIQKATDVLRPVFDATHGADGFVSIEVSPYLAMDTEATIAEAKQLWRAVDRKNLMIKVPGTPEGLPAIRELIAEGINVNITLLFAQAVYEEVVEAYLTGLEMLAAERRRRVADRQRRELLRQPHRHRGRQIARRKNRPGQRPGRKTPPQCAQGQGRRRQRQARLSALSAAVRRRALARAQGQRRQAAAAALGVDRHQEQSLQRRALCRGADRAATPSTPCRSRRWMRSATTASCATASPKTSPTRSDVLSELARAGISLDAVTDKLVDDGVRLFADAADKLLAAVAKKRAEILDQQVDEQELGARPSSSTQEVGELAEEWRKHGNIRKLWQRDKSLWTGADEDRWLGWLDSVGDAELANYAAFAAGHQTRRISRRRAARHGRIEPGPGSAGHDVRPKRRLAAPARSRFHRAGADRGARSRPRSRQDPVHRLEQVRQHDRAQCSDGLFLQARRRRSRRRPSRSGISSPSPIRARRCRNERQQQKFRQVFYGVPSIGGRYSVLSPFGLVPAAIAGIDVAALVQSTRVMMRSCGPDVPPAENPGVALGLALGAAAAARPRQGHDLRLAALPSFGAWAEQLFAESTGKQRQGPDPDRRRAARPARGLRRRSLLYRSCARRRGR